MSELMYLQKVESAKSNIQPLAIQKRIEWENQQIELRVANGEDYASAVQHVKSISSGKHINLDDGHSLYLANKEQVTVGEIKLNPDKYENKSFYDPIEGLNYQVTGKLYKNVDPISGETKLIIHSFAHGSGNNFYLCGITPNDFKIFDDDVVDIDSSNASLKEPALSNETTPIKFPPPFRGWMKDLYQSALKAAHRPQPDLTTLSVLTGMASAIPNGYHLRNGSRLNIFGLAICESGGGKDILARLANHIGGLSGAILIGKPASGQGLEDALVDHAPILASIDEVGHMFQAMNDHKAASYLRELNENLLKLYSAGQNSNYAKRVRANTGNSATSKVLKNPCLSVLGFTTPASLSKGLSEHNIQEGLLGRFLMVEGKQNVRAVHDAQALILDEEKLRHMSTMLSFSTFDGNGGLDDIEIKQTDDATTKLRALIESFDDEAIEHNDDYAKALLKRSYEKLIRIAGVIAVWENHKEPIIELDHLAWAEQAVRSSNYTLINFAKNQIHANDQLANAAKIREVMNKIISGKIKQPSNQQRLITAVNPVYVSRSALLKATHLSKLEFDLALGYLIAIDDVIEESLILGTKKIAYVKFP